MYMYQVDFNSFKFLCASRQIGNNTIVALELVKSKIAMKT